jgi:pyruvate/2-oxoglutarate dehydrogenase complex dihydrolipoamide dehydrogenase (E3) component
MTRPLTPDICFIGGGSSVAPAIAAARASGLSVALVEGAGGDVTRASFTRGQALAAAGRHADALSRGPPFGVFDSAPQLDFRMLSKQVADLAATAPNGSAARFAALGVNRIVAEPGFRDRRTLVAGDVELRARRFVIATGTLSARRGFDGLDADHCLDEDTVLGLASRPGHLIVVGNGPSAIELAQAWRRLGSEVTLLAGAPPLAGHDPEMAAVVLRRLAAEDVNILEKATVSDAQPRGKSGVRVQAMVDGTLSTIDGTHLVVAERRVPNIAGLGLDKARIAHGEDGISVSPTLRTSNSRVYAIGDVTGGPHLAYVVEHQAMLVVSGMISGRDETFDRALVPKLVFTDPQLAHVGLTEGEALKSHRAARILRWPYAENERAKAQGRTEGHVKLAVDKDGRILGVTIAGAEAAELVGSWALALSKGMSVADLARLPLPTSTFGEIGKRAAISYFPDQRRASIGRKLAGLFRVSG